MESDTQLNHLRQLSDGLQDERDAIQHKIAILNAEHEAVVTRRMRVMEEIGIILIGRQNEVDGRWDSEGCYYG